MSNNEWTRVKWLRERWFMSKGGFACCRVGFRGIYMWDYSDVYVIWCMHFIGSFLLSLSLYIVPIIIWLSRLKLKWYMCRKNPTERGELAENLIWWLGRYGAFFGQSWATWAPNCDRPKEVLVCWQLSILIVDVHGERGRCERKTFGTPTIDIPKSHAKESGFVCTPEITSIQYLNWKM